MTAHFLFLIGLMCIMYVLNMKIDPSHLENRTVKKQSKQLDEVKEHVAILLLHPNDVGQREWPVGVDASVGRGGPGEETKLEEVLHYNCQLEDIRWVMNQQITKFKGQSP